jgi:hypothetical protein
MEGDQIASPRLLPIQPKVQHRARRTYRHCIWKATIASWSRSGRRRRPMPDIGLPPPRRRCRSVYGTLNLPRGGRQVLGADLNCSESRRGGPPFHEASGLNKPRWPRRPAPWSNRPTFGARVRRAQLSKGSEIMPRPRTRSASNPAGHCAARCDSSGKPARCPRVTRRRDRVDAWAAGIDCCRV